MDAENNIRKLSSRYAVEKSKREIRAISDIMNGHDTGEYTRPEAGVLLAECIQTKDSDSYLIFKHIYNGHLNEHKEWATLKIKRAISKHPRDKERCDMNRRIEDGFHKQFDKQFSELLEYTEKHLKKNLNTGLCTCKTQQSTQRGR